MGVNSSLNIKKATKWVPLLVLLYARLQLWRTGYTAWLESRDRISRQNFPIGFVRPFSQLLRVFRFALSFAANSC